MVLISGRAGACVELGVTFSIFLRGSFGCFGAFFLLAVVLRFRGISVRLQTFDDAAGLRAVDSVSGVRTPGAYHRA